MLHGLPGAGTIGRMGSGRMQASRLRDGKQQAAGGRRRRRRHPASSPDAPCRRVLALKSSSAVRKQSVAAPLARFSPAHTLEPALLPAQPIGGAQTTIKSTGNGILQTPRHPACGMLSHGRPPPEPQRERPSRTPFSLLTHFTQNAPQVHEIASSIYIRMVKLGVCHQAVVGCRAGSAVGRQRRAVR